ncbi:TonB-dependent receptor [Flavobacterium sufflavum]|uniref:TonB-dependent receptor n=1 Tax=Flavobacterium sufflavum TaxID=1921138 RepID=A0A437L132_9FLAO|nr:TonB-dependent receptor [Flavobacterium sufflavum]RVT78643.1 TonB-dependent receptor [Flavobacterium sufflavum]
MEIKVRNAFIPVRERLIKTAMRAFIFLWCTNVFCLNVGKTFAQANVTIEKDQSVTIFQVFKIIKQQTDLNFVYPRKVFKDIPDVELKKGTIAVTKLLGQCLSKNNLNFELTDDNTILIKEKAVVVNKAVQQKTISGKITDGSGQPIPGANIVEKGTTNGVQSDFDGKFSLSVKSEKAILVVSYIGFTTKEIPLNGQSNLVIKLQEDSAKLEEVVVVGYGSVKKKDLTGAVVSVGAEKLEGRSNTNVLQSLAGQATGVQITQSQGAPGLAPTVKVRGASSINAGTTPLYVIDGIPLEDSSTNSTDTGITTGSNLSFNRNPLNFINPNDIESIDILKDASSAAIYGSRGANGVVIITTKQGKAGKTKIDATIETGFSHVNRTTKMMNASEFIAFNTAARNNSWATIVAANPTATRGLNVTVPVEFSDPAWLARIGNGTDWQDVALRTAHNKNFQLSASGGNEKTQFMASLGFLDSEGVVDRNTYDRINLRSNIKHKFNDNIRMGLNIGLSRAKEAPYGTGGKSDVVSLALQSDPFFPLYVETGSLGFKDPASIWNTFSKYGFQLWHPYSLTREASTKKTTNISTITSYLEWDVIKDLTFKTSASSNIENTFYNFYWNAGQNWGYSGWVPAQADFKTLQSNNWISETTLNYNKTFNEAHTLNLLAGYSAQEQTTDTSSMTAGSFPNDLVHTLNAGVVNAGNTFSEEWSLVSYLARANYSYKGKYLASAAIRADGSSRFGANNRWGYFPSGSLAWRISEESFLKDVSWISNLKVRLSYGATGNNSIPNYGSIGTLGYSPYVSSGTVNQGIYTSNFADKNLKWEKTGQTNFGVDFSVFNGRVKFTGDIYYSKTKDLLLNVPIPILSGFSSTLTNIGELENRGIELNLSTQNIDSEFKWSTDFNISANRNKVLKLGANDAPIDINVSSMTSRTAVGEPIGMYYGYVIDGVIMSKAELDSKAYPVWPGSEAGDPRVRDVNNDGKIDSNDRTYLGNYQPNFQWGMTNNFSYAGFELSVLLRGSQGGEILNHNARYLKSGVGGGNRNMYAEVNNYWKSDAEPGNGMIPKPRMLPTTVRDFGSSYWVEDGSFVRIQNIRMGYNLPKTLVNKMKLSNVKLYVNLENVHVFSDYLGYDPEGSTYQSGVLVGFDYGAYPNPFTATAGLNISF